MTTYEYCTASEVQEELRATTAFSSSTYPSLTTVQRWIEQASSRINDIGQTIYGATQYPEYIDYDQEDVIELKHAPIITVSSVQYNTTDVGSTATWVTKTEDTDYLVYTKRGTIEPIWKYWQPKAGRKRIKVTYTAGYTEVPGIVGELCAKMVAQRVLDSLARYNVEQGNTGGSVSVGSIAIVEPANLGLGFYTRLAHDIETLKEDLKQGSGAVRYGI